MELELRGAGGRRPRQHGEVRRDGEEGQGKGETTNLLWLLQGCCRGELAVAGLSQKGKSKHGKRSESTAVPAGDCMGVTWEWCSWKTGTSAGTGVLWLSYFSLTLVQRNRTFLYIFKIDIKIYI